MVKHLHKIRHKTTLSWHNSLCRHFGWYHHWHAHPYHRHFHVAILLVFLLKMAIIISPYFYFDQILAQNQQAAVRQSQSQGQSQAQGQGQEQSQGQSQGQGQEQSQAQGQGQEQSQARGQGQSAQQTETPPAEQAEQAEQAQPAQQPAPSRGGGGPSTSLGASGGGGGGGSSVSQPASSSTPTSSSDAETSPSTSISDSQVVEETSSSLDTETPTEITNAIAETAPTFTRNLRYGSLGTDVKALQTFLNQNGFILAASGYGSPGNETEFFGPRTRAALIKFQEAHQDKILAPLDLTEGTGFLGDYTMEYIDSILEAEAVELALEAEEEIKIFNEGATHTCKITPFSQKIARGGSQSRFIKLQGSTLPFELGTGKLPDGLSLSFDAASGQGEAEVGINLAATQDADKGSFNTVVIYDIMEGSNTKIRNFCQLNVVVE